MSIPKTSAGSGNIYLGSNLIAEGNCGQWRPGENTIAYYPLNGDILDYSGNGYNGTRTNGAFFEDVTSSKKAANFSRSHVASFINTNCKIVPNTVSFFWRKTELTTSSEDRQQIIGQAQSDSGQWQFRSALFSSYYPNNDQSFVLNGSSSNYNICHGISNRPYGTSWHHICLVNSGNTTLLYVDTVFVHTFSVKMGSAPDGLRIGGRGNANSYRAACAMGDLILESVGRSQQDITKYYNLIKSQYGL